MNLTVESKVIKAYSLFYYKQDNFYYIFLSATEAEIFVYHLFFFTMFYVQILIFLNGVFSQRIKLLLIVYFV